MGNTNSTTCVTYGGLNYQKMGLHPQLLQENNGVKVNTNFAIFDFKTSQALDLNGFPTGNIAAGKNNDTVDNHSQKYMMYAGDINIDGTIKTNGMAGGFILSECKGNIQINSQNGKKETIIVQNSPNVVVASKDDEDIIIHKNNKKYYNR